jgi:hypothetical protein
VNQQSRHGAARQSAKKGGTPAQVRFAKASKWFQAAWLMATHEKRNRPARMSPQALQQQQKRSIHLSPKPANFNCW